MSEEIIFANLELHGPLAATLRRHADRLGENPGELLADLIETVLADDLVGAVLDR